MAVQGLRLREVAEILTADEDAIPPTPLSQRSLEEPELREITATNYVDHLFRMISLGHLANPRRWSRLFLAAATRYEGRTKSLREDMYVAVSLGDVDALKKVKLEVSSRLFSWWTFDLGLCSRASRRNRPELLEMLPELWGDEYPGLKRVGERRAAQEARPQKGSQDVVWEKQRGEVIIAIVQEAFEKIKEIDLHALREELNSRESGLWKKSDQPARGVNYGAPTGQYSGWRPLHFVAGSTGAVDTAVDTVETLVEARADPRLPDASGFSALHNAALRGNTLVVEVLLEYGVEVEAHDKYGCSALLNAARTRKAEIVRRIVKWVMPDDTAEELLLNDHERVAMQYSALSGVKMHRHCAEGDLLTVRTLIEIGDGNGDNLADVNFADSKGKRAVHIATASISSDQVASDMLRMLVAFKADVDVRDLGSAETALHVAARLGRAQVVRTLLRLKAHPTILDKDGRTPLMLCAVCPGQSREKPVYDGVLTNKPYTWTAIQDVLEWDGNGTAPGPKGYKVRKHKGLAAKAVPELFDATGSIRNQLKAIKDKKKKKKVEEAEEEDEGGSDADDAVGDEDEKEERKEVKYVPSGSAFLTKVEAIISLGFDDQRIRDNAGRFNRGDRLQMSKQLFLKPKGAPKDAALEPQEKRLRVLWRQLTCPLLQLELQRKLSQRESDLLQYLLSAVLGNQRGECFGFLVAAGIGVKSVVLPSWDLFEETLNENDDLSDRAAELRSLFFRGPKPRRQLWVGAVWSPDEYPREPDMAPWDAFEYIDREDADWINSRGGKPEPTGEAFKGNDMDPFEPNFKPSVVGEKRHPPHRGELLRLQDKLLVSEYMAQWNSNEEECWERLKLIGNRLLCPLLFEAIDGLSGDEEKAKEAAAHRELLRYVVGQLDEPQRRFPKPRRAYDENWVEVRMALLIAVLNHPAPEMATARLPPIFIEDDYHGRDPVQDGQAACLPVKDIHWLRRRQSVLAYVTLLRAKAIRCADDFNEIVVALAAACSLGETLVECFWRACYGMLLWGRAQPLLPILERVLHKRLGHKKDMRIRGPRLMTRSEVLSLAVSKLDEWKDKTVHRRVKDEKVLASGKACHVCGERHWPPVDEVNRMSQWVWWCGKCGAKQEPPQLSKDQPPLPPPPLPSLPTAEAYRDILRAEIVCANEESMLAALDELTQPMSPPQSRQDMKSSAGRRPSVDAEGIVQVLGKAGQPAPGYEEAFFRAISIRSDFHGERQNDVFPRCAGILLVCEVGSDVKVQQEHLRQLCEIELVFEQTQEARWLVETVGCKTTDPDVNFAVVRDQENKGKRRRRQRRTSVSTM
eukprot:TRINITY_DN36_c0_g2_i1.p1 TRINITY_DN36_c0_g2~~TRINITY_DN36_c0_g2_i1.p1  ORF type:complete len:1312 (-),score=356.59 TRINITY_DN36_c0_g2_i1:156-4091(-)